MMGETAEAIPISLSEKVADPELHRYPKYLSPTQDLSDLI